MSACIIFLKILAGIQHAIWTISDTVQYSSLTQSYLCLPKSKLNNFAAGDAISTIFGQLHRSSMEWDK